MCSPGLTYGDTETRDIVICLTLIYIKYNSNRSNSGLVIWKIKESFENKLPG